MSKAKSARSDISQTERLANDFVMNEVNRELVYDGSETADSIANRIYLFNKKIKAASYNIDTEVLRPWVKEFVETHQQPDDKELDNFIK